MCSGLGVYVVGLSLMMLLEAVSMVQRAASHVRKGTVQPSKPWERFHYLAVTYHKLLGFQGPTNNGVGKTCSMVP